MLIFLYIIILLIIFIQITTAYSIDKFENDNIVSIMPIKTKPTNDNIVSIMPIKTKPKNDDIVSIMPIKTKPTDDVLNNIDYNNYIEYNNVNWIKNYNKTYKDISFKECFKMCNEEPKCLGLTIDKTNIPSCFLSFQNTIDNNTHTYIKKK